MIEPDEYVVTEDDTVTDVDLRAEAVYLKGGRRLTEELAEQLADEALVDARRQNLVS